MTEQVLLSEKSFPVQARSNRSAAGRRRYISLRAVGAFLVGVAGALLPLARGQAPPILWSTNVNARLLAVDDQADAFATTNGQVIRISGSGIPLWTNAMCPNSVQSSSGVAYVSPRAAGRDSSGNFYFAGDFDGTQDFGGITLVGGWTNNPYVPSFWSPGYPTCFLVKYSNAGSLQWVVSFGEQGPKSRMYDLTILSDDSVVVSFDTTTAPYPATDTGILARFSTSGTPLWQSNVAYGCQDIKVKDSDDTNGTFLLFNYSFTLGGVFDSAGEAKVIGNEPLSSHSVLAFNSKPVAGSSNSVYLAGLSGFPPDAS